MWLIGSGAIKYYRLRHLNVSQLDKFTPTNMTEGKLVELLQDEQAKTLTQSVSYKQLNTNNLTTLNYLLMKLKTI